MGCGAYPEYGEAKLGNHTKLYDLEKRGLWIHNHIVFFLCGMFSTLSDLLYI